MKVGRNDPCPCGSGKKYKYCCGATGTVTQGDMNVEAQMAQALTAFHRADYHSALHTAQTILSTSPNHADAHQIAGLSHFCLGNLVPARNHLEQSTRHAPGSALAFSNLARVLEQLGEYKPAETACRRALALDPNLADAHHNLANILKNLERLDEALHEYREAVRLSPDIASYRSNLGVLLMNRGELEDVQAHLEHAIRREPRFAQAHGNLGVLYLHTGKFELARESLLQALRLRPDYAEAMANLAFAWHQLGQCQEAIKLYRQAMALDPNIRYAFSSNLITVLEDAGDLNAAYAAALEVLENPAECAGSLIAASKNFGKTCDFARRERAERLWYQYVSEKRLPPTTLLACQYSGSFSPEELFALHRRWAQTVEPTGQEAGIVPEIRSGREGQRLRIGYLSPDFRGHATAYFIEPIIAAHDPDGFEIFCYHTHRREDAMTDRIREHGRNFLNVSGLSDQELRAQIQDDGIDILVDLAGHTDGSRLKMMARRAAPIQASYLGYPNTTGLSAIDYLIVDDYIAKPGMNFCTEVPAILPECLVTFQDLPIPPGGNAPPSHETGHVTFGSLNNLMKLTARTVSCWAQILAQVPESRLLIAYGGADATCTREHLEGEFARHGIAADRLQLHGKCPREDFLSLYRRIDMHLDTFPYTGTTTTCEALMMNVPVVTKTGLAQRERVSASILSHLGLEHLIARDESAYVEIAVKLARDPQALEAIRRALPGLLSRSVIRKPARLARSLERLYEEMWRRYQNQDRSCMPLVI